MSDIEAMAKAVYQKYGDGGGAAQDADRGGGGLGRQSSLLSSNGDAVSMAGGSMTSRRSGHVPAPLQVSDLTQTVLTDAPCD